MSGQLNMCVIYRHSKETTNNIFSPIFCLSVFEQKQEW